MKVRKSLSLQRGATLLEALSFLAVAAIVIVGSVSAYKNAQSSAASSSIDLALRTLRSNIESLSAGQSFYGVSGWSTTVASQGLNTRLTSTGSIPDTLRISGGNIFTQFGGSVQVDGDATTFWIRFNNVPRDMCIRAASGTGNSWMGVSINGNWVDTSLAPVPVNTANALCSTPAANYMIWRAQ